MGLIFSTLKQEKMFKKSTIYFCSGVVSVSWDAIYAVSIGVSSLHLSRLQGVQGLWGYPLMDRVV